MSNVPTTGPISFLDLKTLFQISTTTVSMSQMYRGGAFVPDIADNSSVPASGQFQIQTLRGAKKNAAASGTLPVTAAIVQAYMANNYSGSGNWTSLQGGGSMTKGTGTTYATSPYPRFQFTGVTGQTFTGVNIPLASLSAFTVALLVRKTGLGGTPYPRLFACHPNYDSGIEVAVSQSTSALEYYTSPTGWVTTSIILPINTWRSVIVSYDMSGSTSNLTIYVNGVLGHTRDISTRTVKCTGVQVCTITNGGGEVLGGDLAGVIAFNRTLTGAEAVETHNYFSTAIPL